MKKLSLGYLFLVMLVVIASAQEPTRDLTVVSSQGNVAAQPAINALAAYTKWRTDTLLNYPQGLLTPHYAVAIVAQRLDDCDSAGGFTAGRRYEALHGHYQTGNAHPIAIG